MNSRSVAIFAVVVAVIVGVALWFLNSEHAPHQLPPVTSTTPPPATKPAANVQTPPAPQRPTVTPPLAERPAALPRPPAVAQQMTEDDRKIDDILKRFPGNTDADNTNTAQALINILPTLTADGQSEAAQHVANLLSDEEFHRVMPLWKNPGTNSDVIDVLGTDLMNRENKVMLPAMLEAAKMPKHPFHDDALSTLQIFLDEDYGENIPKWEAAMKKFLKQEADEEAESNAPSPAPKK